MKHCLLVLTATLVIFSLPQQTFSRDDQLVFPIGDALSTPEAKDKLKGIDFYFGNQKHPQVLKDFGEFNTNKKTNAFNKSDKQACEWAFLSALLQLQDRARNLNANAVINIKSNYKHREYASEKEFECGAGHIMAGVALKGRIVKLAR
ncbi:MAG: hypothetical protein JRE65_06265 [Deltaproteobacteria bacterium]|jgi:uncharacterized protein YbjQ (UPF0145 family)|nr:hypothetical protein [Deltaproteobacteria bacterium]